VARQALKMALHAGSPNGPSLRLATRNVTPKQYRSAVVTNGRVWRVHGSSARQFEPVKGHRTTSPQMTYWIFCRRCAPCIYKGCQRDQLAFSCLRLYKISQLRTSVSAITALRTKSKLAIPRKSLKTWSGRGESNPRIQLGNPILDCLQKETAFMEVHPVHRDPWSFLSFVRNPA
jgi:hypothetical protein